MKLPFNITKTLIQRRTNLKNYLFGPQIMVPLKPCPKDFSLDPSQQPVNSGLKRLIKTSDVLFRLKGWGNLTLPKRLIFISILVTTCTESHLDTKVERTHLWILSLTARIPSTYKLKRSLPVKRFVW